MQFVPQDRNGIAALTAGPERGRLSLAVPHPGACAANIPRNPAQLLRSWYIAFFQLGGLADQLAQLRDYALLRRLWRTWSPGYELPESYFERLAECLSQSWPAPLMYYRAYSRDRQARERMPELARSRIIAPVLYIHGRQDA